MNSIRIRLFVWQTGAFIVATLLVSLITYQLAWDGFNRVRNFALEQIAYSILRHGIDPDLVPSGDKSIGQFVSQVWDTQGNLQFSSKPELKLPRQQPGLNHLEWLGEEWHIFTVANDGRLVQVANTAANRDLMFAEISRWLLIPLAVLIGVLGGLLSIAVREALTPLDFIRQEISGRDIDRLHEFPPADYPTEISPLVDALNKLLTRLDQMLSTQRRFVADAAHELRTPLTAIKLQTQVAMASPDEKDRRIALELLQVSVDRAAHLVDQLLQLARIDPTITHNRPRTSIRLDELSKKLVIEYSVFADKMNIDLGLGHCDQVGVNGDVESLRILLGNLIDNALRYGKPGGKIDVEVHTQEGNACLWVIDNGAGIPDAEKQMVFERFHRLAGADIPGSGLGLAIVHEIVSQHGGKIDLLDTAGGGLSVRVTLPTA